MAIGTEPNRELDRPALVVLLLLANGFFVAAEFAYITARRNVLEQVPRRSAQIAVGLQEPTLSLAAAQLGITMASLVLGAVAGPPWPRSSN